MPLFKTVLLVHIVAGSLGLLSGSINIVRRKGGRNHRIIGKVFLFAMLTVGFTSFGLAILHPSAFLFSVGTFTVYMVGTGERYMFLKNLNSTQKPLLIDWMLTFFMGGSVLFFMGFGLHRIFQGDLFALVYLAFGYLGGTMVLADFKNYLGKSKVKNYWLIVHLQRMTGAFVAAFTAFLVVNIKWLPGYIVWLLPTALLLPFILKWTAKYKILKKREDD